jgi:hypothetical protein
MSVARDYPKRRKRMNLKTRYVSVLAILALGGTVAVSSAQQKTPQQPTKASDQASKAKSNAVDHVAHGSVVSMSDTSMVLRMKKGKDLTLTLKPDTEKIGSIANGKPVTVHYRDDKGQHVATSIQESNEPQTSPTAKSKTK